MSIQVPISAVLGQVKYIATADRALLRFPEIEQKVECSKQLGRDFFSSASTIFAILNQSNKV
jgi:hypothetical protein